MNYGIQEYYDELYRIFSEPDVLLTQTQTVLLGDALRSLVAGENVTFKLNTLYQAVENIKKIAEPLEHYIHEYIKFVEENDIEENKTTITEEEITDGTRKEY